MPALPSLFATPFAVALAAVPAGAILLGAGGDPEPCPDRPAPVRPTTAALGAARPQDGDDGGGHGLLTATEIQMLLVIALVLLLAALVFWWLTAPPDVRDLP